LRPERDLDLDTRRFFSGDDERLLRFLARELERSRDFLRSADRSCDVFASADRSCDFLRSFLIFLSRDLDLDCFFLLPLDSDLCFLREPELDLLRPLEDDLFLSRDLDLLLFLSRDLDRLSLELFLLSELFLFLTGDGELEALFLDFLAGALSSSSEELEESFLPLTLVDALSGSGLAFSSFLGLKYCGIRFRA